MVCNLSHPEVLDSSVKIQNNGKPIDIFLPFEGWTTEDDDQDQDILRRRQEEGPAAAAAGESHGADCGRGGRGGSGRQPVAGGDVAET